MEQIIIREATLSDTALLTHLGAQTFYEAFAAVNTEEDMNMYLAETFTDTIIKKEFDEAGSQFFIAYVDNIPAGYAKIRWQAVPGDARANAAEIQRLYVLSQYQNMHIGTMLMERCLATIQKEGMAKVWLGVWEHNAGAIRFYERYGFIKFGSHIFQLGTDPQTDYLMKLSLTPPQPNS